MALSIIVDVTGNATSQIVFLNSHVVYFAIVHQFTI